jgi:CheY-like chemotaxis protein
LFNQFGNVCLLLLPIIWQREIGEFVHLELWEGIEIGYKVELTKDGAEAVDLYRKARESGQPFAAVILDLTVPGGMGGKETIKKLLEIDPEVKAIVSSGYSTDPIMSDFKKFGFSAFVTKPYSVSQIEEKLHDVLANK